MPTTAELAELEQANDDLKAVMVAALVAHWMENVQGSPADAAEELREFVIDLVAEFGQASAALAIDFYESVRPPGAPSFQPTPALRDDLVTRPTLIWATDPLFTEEFEQSLERLSAEIQKASQQAVVDTIGTATEDDPLDVRFARFPQNDDPCAYCVFRASRGAVYWSEETATSGDHVKCGCLVTPVFSDEPLPYMRAPYMAQYLNGASAAELTLADIRADESLSPKVRREQEFKALLAGMRSANGLR